MENQRARCAAGQRPLSLPLPCCRLDRCTAGPRPWLPSAVTRTPTAPPRALPCGTLQPGARAAAAVAAAAPAVRCSRGAELSSADLSLEARCCTSAAARLAATLRLGRRCTRPAALLAAVPPPATCRTEGGPGASSAPSCSAAAGDCAPSVCHRSSVCRRLLPPAVEGEGRPRRDADAAMRAAELGLGRPRRLAPAEPLEPPGLPGEGSRCAGCSGCPASRPPAAAPQLVCSAGVPAAASVATGGVPGGAALLLCGTAGAPRCRSGCGLPALLSRLPPGRCRPSTEAVRACAPLSGALSRRRPSAASVPLRSPRALPSARLAPAPAPLRLVPSRLLAPDAASPRVEGRARARRASGGRSWSA